MGEIMPHRPTRKVGTHCAQEAVIALDNLSSGIEEQERAGSEGTLGLATLEALVPDQSTLLISDETANGHALQATICNVAVNVRGRNELGQDRSLQPKELQQSRVPLELLQVHEERTRGI